MQKRFTNQGGSSSPPLKGRGVPTDSFRNRWDFFKWTHYLNLWIELWKFLVPDYLLYTLHSFKERLAVALRDLEVPSRELHLTQTNKTVIPVDYQIYLRIRRDIERLLPIGRYMLIAVQTIRPHGVIKLLKLQFQYVLFSLPCCIIHKVLFIFSRKDNKKPFVWPNIFAIISQTN